MKKRTKQILSFTLSLILTSSALPMFSFATTPVSVSLSPIEGSPASIVYPDEELHLEGKNNVQQYVTSDNQTHTLYWAQGVTPPKMTSDKKKLGKPGYFEKESLGDPNKITSITYQAPMKTQQGYFDLNKNKNLSLEQHMCYLAASSNLLHWWLRQNKDYILQYVQGIKEGTFGQEENLVSLKEIDWDYILSEPEMVFHDSHYLELLQNSSLVNTAFKNNYYKRSDDGYWMDPVIDFFINGYKPIQPNIDINGAPINHPNKFEPNMDGGYFHPIFGKTKLTEHYRQKQYEFFNHRIKDWLMTGKSICIGFYFTNNVAHAITVWGAEYDAKGNLCRFYVTDSDDYDNTPLSKYDTSRGLYSVNVKNHNDILYIGNNEGPLAGPGNMIENLVTFDLAQDVWESVLYGHETEPAEPQIQNALSSRKYAKNAIALPLQVDVALKEEDKQKGAYLTYQWFKADADGDVGQAIQGANLSTYTPKISNAVTTEYYYCAVTNHQYGKKSTLKTNYAKIETLDIPLQNAAMPNISFYSGTETISQYAHTVLTAQILNPEEMDTLSYQWYHAQNNTDGGYIEAIPGATDSTFLVPTDQIGTDYYFCKITNVDERSSVTGTPVAVYQTKIKRINIVKPQNTVTISFSAGEGRGTMASIQVPKGQPFALPQCTFIAPKNKHFLKWDAGYIGSSLNTTTDQILHAQWADGLSIVASGSLSPTIHWSLTSDGRLNLDGDGTLQSVPSSLPWQQHQNRVESITIGEGITSVSNLVFQNCMNLKYIRLSQSVEDIGDALFQNARQVTFLIHKNSAGESFVKENNLVYHYSGDMDGNDLITPGDYDTILKDCTLYRQTALSPFDFEVADINGDGAVDAFDLSLCDSLMDALIS